MALTDVTTITFDADDTLWDFNAGMLTAPRPLRAEIAELVGGAVETLGALRREAIRRSASDAGLSDSSVVDGLFDLYISARLANTPLLPETESTLAILGERFQLGAITNSDADPVAFGLSSQFSFAVLADVEPYRKPDPCIFQHAASIGGYQLGRSIHVGDSLTTDVRGANRAGAISVWLDRNRDASDPSISPHHTIRSLSELPGLLGIA